MKLSALSMIALIFGSAAAGMIIGASIASAVGDSSYNSIFLLGLAFCVFTLLGCLAWNAYLAAHIERLFDLFMK